MWPSKYRNIRAAKASTSRLRVRTSALWGSPSILAITSACGRLHEHAFIAGDSAGAHASEEAEIYTGSVPCLGIRTEDAQHQICRGKDPRVCVVLGTTTLRMRGHRTIDGRRTGSFA